MNYLYDKLVSIKNEQYPVEVYNKMMKDLTKCCENMYAKKSILSGNLVQDLQFSNGLVFQFNDLIEVKLEDMDIQTNNNM